MEKGWARTSPQLWEMQVTTITSWWLQSAGDRGGAPWTEQRRPCPDTRGGWSTPRSPCSPGSHRRTSEHAWSAHLQGPPSQASSFSFHYRQRTSRVVPWAHEVAHCESCQVSLYRGSRPWGQTASRVTHRVWLSRQNPPDVSGTRGDFCSKAQGAQRRTGSSVCSNKTQPCPKALLKANSYSGEKTDSRPGGFGPLPSSQLWRSPPQAMIRMG